MSAGDRARGMYRKWKTSRLDGSSMPGGKHNDCDRFVLDLDHDLHALPALSAYADSCAAAYPMLAAELRVSVELRRHRNHRDAYPAGCGVVGCRDCQVKP